MNTEEKARRYDEALEKMRKMFKPWSELAYNGKTFLQDLKHIFPELTESEDERIRKVIYKLMLGMREEIFTSQDEIVTKEKVLAWFEKQKENTEKEYVFRPLAGTDINTAVLQAIRRANEGDRLVLAFNGAYIPVRKGVDANKIVDIYDAFIEKQKEHLSCPDAPKEKSDGGDFYSSDKDKNLDEIAQDYVDGVKQYNQEPTWDLMQTAVCYGYHLSEEQFEKNRLANCDAVSKEECDRETDFAMGIIEKEHRQPTFNDAINYGMRLQKEQKPAESRKRNKPKESWLSRAKYEIEHADELLIQKQEELREIRELKQKEQKPLTTEETELNSIAFLEQMGYTCIPPGKEQKPTEKQEYSGLNDFERAIHRGFLSAGVENVPVTIIRETAKECLAQMKPAEWSEEDDWKRKELIQYLEEKGDYRTVWMTWLKSLPIRCPKKSDNWKPSEEQMSMLLAVINDPNNAGAESCYMALNSIYNNLKKL